MPGQVTERDTVAGTLSCVLQLLCDVRRVAGAIGVDLQAECLHVDALNATVDSHDSLDDRREELGVLRVLGVSGVGVDREVGATSMEAQVEVVVLLTAIDLEVMRPRDRDGVVDLD